MYVGSVLFFLFALDSVQLSREAGLGVTHLNRAKFCLGAPCIVGLYPYTKSCCLRVILVTTVVCVEERAQKTKSGVCEESIVTYLNLKCSSP